jgi:hypothetical protein
VTPTPTTTPDDTLLVVNVSLTGSERDYDARVTFLDRRYRIVRQGTDGDVEAARNLVRRWKRRADAIAVTGVREARAAGLYDGDLDAVEKVRAAAGDEVATTDGHALHDVLQEWAVRHLRTTMPGYFDNARTVVLGGSNHDRTVRVLRESTRNLEFADPLLRLDLPATLHSVPLLGMAGDAAAWPLHHLPGPVRGRLRAPGQAWSHALARKAARDCDVVVATYDELTGFGLEDLAGKTLVSSAISDDRLEELASRGVDLGQAELSKCVVGRPQRARGAVAVAGRHRERGPPGDRHPGVPDDLGEGTQPHDLGAQLLGGLRRRQQASVGELGTVRQHLVRSSPDGDEPALGGRAGRGGNAGDVAVGERRAVGHHLLHQVHHRLRRDARDGAQRLHVAQILLRQGVDHEREPALALRAVGPQEPRLQLGGDDHVQQVVVGEGAVPVHRRGHQRLQRGRVDRQAVERLRRHVDDQVHAPGAQVGQPLR